ncbi:3-keto-disaccharide hydrolase [Paremcibacter congregatus]|uniref:3-keto-alpha-glucoside-1,2-lyase/3-keto-2-hydroxy-glucal hydratase domain-containing protein n=1 Tax=Paremcibacter congregatus TaxID=2043170 RepID=A0A2G4YW98_9PROT|nr:DUF1080 domain-containing protein [Paremcibacter congregatus]PHZ86614.1 hypothetical protein CRD36_01670 [Paremcibacter congregatus]QDE26416.1 DUF1080 domain-containing protein [Paremcibacter congregatus]
MTRKNPLTLLSLPLFSLALLFNSVTNAGAEDKKWINLFNGKDLDGWVIKFTGHDLGENYQKTFQVKDSKLVADYSNYTAFDNNFGHIFYTQKFSNYTLKLEYRFTGEQTSGGPGWAYRNSGIMIHSQPPESMARDQLFPASVEVQLLGGRDTDPRPTANVCTPATHINLNGKLETEHCINSTSATFRGDQWVMVEVEVRNSQMIRHSVNGVTVLEYNAPQVDTTDEETPPYGPAGNLLRDGYIALQAESHPVEFRNIRVLNHDQ